MTDTTFEGSGSPENENSAPTGEVTEAVTPTTPEAAPEKAAETAGQSTPAPKEQDTPQVPDDDEDEDDDDPQLKADRDSFKSLTEDQYLKNLKRARELRNENRRVKQENKELRAELDEKDSAISDYRSKETSQAKKDILATHHLPETFIKYLDAAGDTEADWKAAAKDLAKGLQAAPVAPNTPISGFEGKNGGVPDKTDYNKLRREKSRKL